MMVKVLLYGYCTGVASSRLIAQRLHEDIAFGVLAANNTLDLRTISDFRKDHLEALADLFLQVFELCQQAELVRRDPESEPIRFQSDIQRLSAFAGYQSYGPHTGGEDYRELSNSVTADLVRIYALIEGLTQENPWEVPTRLRGLRVEPGHR